MKQQIEKSHAVDVEKIKKYLQTMNLASNLSTAEVEQFIEIAQSFELNPFKREIYANKYGDKFSVIVGYETYIKRAERSGLLSGWNVKTEGTIDRQNLMNSDLRAIITIWRKDFQFEFIHEVYFIEYVGRRRDGSVTDFWKNKPITMIKKVATAQGFRLCFSDELGGMPYTSEELSTIEAEAEIISSAKLTPKPERKKKSEAEAPQSNELIKEAISFDPGRIESLKEAINSCESVDSLVEIWKSNSDIHSNPDFKNTMTARKNYLKNNIQEAPKAEIKNVEDQKKDLPGIIITSTPKAEEKPQIEEIIFEAKAIESNPEDLSEENFLIQQIANAETADEVLDLTFEISDRDVLRFAEEKLKSFELKS